ncbi:hypothetical protein [Bradyrhizobium erythrophlei]|uniref:Uncharacterized protein n=1 Tax=Bradyrhizobium erythrophlei TaxID=1437360 RepID=A0A1M5NGG0_9BRAD|nr:hypothetical protein [Bradyrhizobium erythrophlei]SHG88644.1 hypothetical protein SAMN05443248_2988 [Bradyrhizobium erythrophlei]
MKTLYRYTGPEDGVTVRLIERQTIVQPMSVNTSFAVVIDAPGEVAMFDSFSGLEFAAGAFALLVERFGGVTQAGQVVVVP